MEKEQCWRVFKALDTNLIKPEWEALEDTPDFLESILQALSGKLNFDFTLEEFSETESLDASESELEAFTSRLRNIVLKKLYELETPEIPLEEFIAQKANITEESHSSASGKEEPAPGSSEIASEQSNSKTESIPDSGPIIDAQEDNFSQEYVPKSADSWFSRTIFIHKDRIHDSFKAVDYENPYIDIKKNLKILFDNVLVFAEVTVTDESAHRFYDLIDEKYATEDYFGNLAPTFEKFVGILEDWATDEEKARNQYENILACTIKEFRNLAEEFSFFNEDIKEFVGSLTGFFSKYTNNKQPKKKLDKKRILFEIFEFYAKSLKLIGTKPTFEQIEANNNIWNISKFIKFLSDFSLLNRLTTAKAQLIFKKIATLTRFMDKNQFVESIHSISEELFGKDRIEDLYELMGLNTMAYRDKFKQFTVPFSRDGKRRNRRLPIEDPALKYTFRISPQRQAKLDKWRQSKVYAVSPMPIRSKLSPTPMRVPTSGYAKRKLARSMITQGTYSNESKSVVHSAPLQIHQPLTFQALGKLDYPEVAGDSSIRGLVSQDSDYMLEKIYGIRVRDNLGYKPASFR